MEPATEDLSLKKIAFYTIAFVAVSLPVGLIFARSIAVNNKLETTKIESSDEYVGLDIASSSKELTGKIIVNIDPSINATHKLLDPESREVLAYIYANSDILKVSEGFNVTVIGNVEGKVKDDYNLVKVDRIKLK